MLIHVYKHDRTHARTHARTHVHTHAHTHTPRTHTHSHAHTHTHTRMHAHTHARTHTAFHTKIVFTLIPRYEINQNTLHTARGNLVFTNSRLSVKLRTICTICLDCALGVIPSNSRKALIPKYCWQRLHVF